MSISWADFHRYLGTIGAFRRPIGPSGALTVSQHVMRFPIVLKISAATATFHGTQSTTHQLAAPA
jgi:hypothetical protein